MSDARTSMFEQLRGFEGFEDVYTGLPATTPIVLTNRSSGLDPMAEAPNLALRQYLQGGGTFPANLGGDGIDPFLVAGLPVPMMSTVMIYLPVIASLSERGIVPYEYTIYWRIRSFETQRNDEPQAFHGSNEGFGPDTTGQYNFVPTLPFSGAYAGGIAKRYPVIVAAEPIRYVATPPLTDEQGPGISRIRQSVSVPIGSDPFLPVFPPVATSDLPIGQLGQGVSKAAPFNGVASHLIQTTMAKGDEMVVLVRRVEGPETWQFGPSDSDYLLSVVLGRGLVLQPSGYQRVDAGVFVATGYAP